MNTSSRIQDLVHSWLSKLVRGDEEQIGRLHCCTPNPIRSRRGSADAESSDAGDRQRRRGRDG